MYSNEHFSETRLDTLHQLVREHPLGMLVFTAAGTLDADHLPFLLDDERGAFGTLVAHVARANAIWQRVSHEQEVLVVFRGAQGYISPSWYPSKHETHRHVPTWNYEVVHAHGRITIHDDERFVRGVVARLTRQHEAQETAPWKMSDAEPDYLAAQLREIVGIEIEITRLQGKRKLSQNRTARDFSGTVNALEARGQVDLADAMKRT